METFSEYGGLKVGDRVRYLDDPPDLEMAVLGDIYSSGGDVFAEVHCNPGSDPYVYHCFLNELRRVENE